MPVREKPSVIALLMRGSCRDPKQDDKKGKTAIESLTSLLR
ncbi:hypothetical protein [Neorickettsia sennetsu]|nr:hypothetical protein [Neorickettsia sennetsu]